jgi:hypothetical protein
MTQLELVKHEQVIDQNGQGIRRTVVAVSSSYSALVDHCKETFKKKIDEVGCGKSKYYTIQESNIAIVSAKF